MSGKDIWGNRESNDIFGNAGDRNAEGERPKDVEGNVPRDIFGNAVGAEEKEE